MAYNTGVITDPSPGPALHTALATLLTSAGYALVDTVVISTRTHKVWKSPAASNAAGLDWYLDVAYTTTGNGNLWLLPFEGYDASTDLALRGIVSGSSITTIDAATGSRFGATASALETNWYGPAQSSTSMALTLTTTAFTYWASITADRVIVMHTNLASSIFYTGLYTPDATYASKAGSALFPLIALRAAPSSSTCFALASPTLASVTAALTRVAPVTALTGSGWGAHVGCWYGFAARGVATPSGSTAIAVPSGSSLYVEGDCNGADAGYVGRFGVLKDIAVGTTTTGAVARGDTVTIGTDTWIACSESGFSRYGMFKQV